MRVYRTNPPHLSIHVLYIYIFISVIAFFLLKEFFFPGEKKYQLLKNDNPIGD